MTGGEAITILAHNYMASATGGEVARRAGALPRRQMRRVGMRLPRVRRRACCQYAHADIFWGAAAPLVARQEAAHTTITGSPHHYYTPGGRPWRPPPIGMRCPRHYYRQPTPLLHAKRRAMSAPADKNACCSPFRPKKNHPPGRVFFSR